MHVGDRVDDAERLGLEVRCALKPAGDRSPAMAVEARWVVDRHRQDMAALVVDRRRHSERVREVEDRRERGPGLCLDPHERRERPFSGLLSYRPQELSAASLLVGRSVVTGAERPLACRGRTDDL